MSQDLVPDWWPDGAKLDESCTGPCPTCQRLLTLAAIHYRLLELDNQAIAPDGQHHDITQYAAQGGTAD